MIFSKFLAARRRWKVIFEGLVAAFALIFAHGLIHPYIYYDPVPDWRLFPLDILIFAGVAALLAKALQTERIVWRYMSILDFAHVLFAVGLSVLTLIAFYSVTLADFPWRLTVLAGALYAGTTIGARLVSRLLRQENFALTTLARDESGAADRMLIMADVGEAEPFLRQMRYGARNGRRVVGLVTHDYRHEGQRIHGFEVLGAEKDLETVIARLERRGKRPSVLAVSSRVHGPEEIRALLRTASRLKMVLARLPELESIDENRRVRVTEIALEDLLERPQVTIDPGVVRDLVKGKRVLVTGAGGSIGSEISRQVAALGCARLILLDHSEFALHKIWHEIRAAHPGLDCADALCDIRDHAYLDSRFQAFQPDIVFHAAALKHVPMVERHPVEGVRTNLFGTRNVARAAMTCGAEAMVMISTDKAVDPESVLGSTKRLAELYLKHLAASGRKGTRFTTVRFGNVLGSTGSVVPLFNQQIDGGGPVTVTHPDVERYFMTITEAVQLVLQAAALDESEAASEAIYVLEMGKPIKIVDLAHQLIRLHGMEPGRDIAVEFTGLREGERLSETLYSAEEAAAPSGVDGVMRVCTQGGVAAAIDDRALDRLEAVLETGEDLEGVARRLSEIVRRPSGELYH